MIKVLLALVMVLSFLGCSSKGEDLTNANAKIVVGQSLANLKLKDQFKKEHGINASTTKLIFAFAKKPAHTCNNYFTTQVPTYLADNNTQFIADISTAPSLIRSMFILPGLKDFKHTVLLLDDRKIAASFRKGMNTEKIVLVTLKNRVISKISTLNSTEELKTAIEGDSSIN